MAKRLSEKDKNQITYSFSNGIDIEALAEKFKCTKSTIIRNLKKSLGEDEYSNLIIKYKSYKEISKINDLKKNNKGINASGTEMSSQNVDTEQSLIDNSGEEVYFPEDSFVEITPLNYEVDIKSQKDLSSVHLSEINLPNVVYLIVDKNIELETKLLKDYPIWRFLPENDLNRKTVEIYYDLKKAKQICNKGQKVIKVPNTDVFRIVTPILLSRGISRIISSDQLIAL